VNAEVADDFDVNPGDRLELAGPVVFMCGQAQPVRVMSLPFGGHAVSQARGVVTICLFIAETVRQAA